MLLFPKGDLHIRPTPRIIGTKVVVVPNAEDTATRDKSPPFGPGLPSLVGVLTHDHRFRIVNVNVVTKKQQRERIVFADVVSYTFVFRHEYSACSKGNLKLRTYS